MCGKIKNYLLPRNYNGVFAFIWIWFFCKVMYGKKLYSVFICIHELERKQNI